MHEQTECLLVLAMSGLHLRSGPGPMIASRCCVPITLACPVGPPAIGFGRLRSEQIEDEVLKNLGGANRAVFRRVRTTHGIHFGVAENHGIRLETSTFGARRPKRIAFGASNSGPLQHPGNRVAANFDVATGGGRQRQSITLHERQRHFRHVHK